MDECCYQTDRFKITQVTDGFILQNTQLDGFQHTHLHNFKTCLYLIKLSEQQRIPRDLPRYLLISLYRINDGAYREKVKELIDNKRKKMSYFNPGRKRRG